MASITENDLKEICQILWSWDFCIGCLQKTVCQVKACPNERMRRLSRYFDYGRIIFDVYAAETPPAKLRKLRNLVLKAIGFIRSSPSSIRAEFLQRLANSREGADEDVEELDRALMMAIKLMFMTNCGHDNQKMEVLESGLFMRSWRGEFGLDNYIVDSFPKTDHPSLNEKNSNKADIIKAALQAKKLKKHANLSFSPTDDIRNHLRLDHQTGVVQIFHYTSFLKEQLRITQHMRSETEAHIVEYMKAGALPRQLVLEVLDSIQKVLFPINDDQSYALLVSMTSSKGGSFDPDCIRFESEEFRSAEESDVAYYYFGARLMELYQESENPRPRGLVAEWLERRSGARYAMLATLIGVFIAILLGLAGLVVSSYQTYIAYQQWKHAISKS
ncbi:hypothetical protein NA57DRAFT_76366 [Rhizodiscina lignyota]|uniref:Uncharacterized protein n=1 Tax=Rhizodiscina lignyota TaxID=1504668 RepID=A0A9P4M6D4_9PEZI|nr:hypothetical protein NA57DRAFT_76366 [Rhizodiscina lignyota]